MYLCYVCVCVFVHACTYTHARTHTHTHTHNRHRRSNGTNILHGRIFDRFRPGMRTLVLLSVYACHSDRGVFVTHIRQGLGFRV